MYVECNQTIMQKSEKAKLTTNMLAVLRSCFDLVNKLK